MSAKSYMWSPEIADFLEKLGDTLSDGEVALRTRTASLEKADYQISVEQGGLMKFLIRLMKAKNYLEIGTFTGYSAACAAQAIPADGIVYTIECDPDYAKIAEQCWRQMGLDDRINLQMGDACTVLQQLADSDEVPTFDVIFIDGDKREFSSYFDLSLNVLARDGLILIDNIFRQGRICETEPDQGTQVVKQLVHKLYDSENLWTSVVPISDGLLMVQQKPNVT